jgi:hypothetical protein
MFEKRFAHYCVDFHCTIGATGEFDFAEVRIIYLIFERSEEAMGESIYQHV